ncbi:MAG: DUF2975 domain-containing protein [Clostridia bacterium]|nr:DUF2975 domain-containing protein [Clostridia bacterium]
MKHSTIILLARIFIIIFALVGLAVAILIPGHTPEQPCLTSPVGQVIEDVLLELCIVLCFAILVIGWLLTSAIRNDTVFTKKTAGLFRIAAFLMLGDAVLYLVTNATRFFVGCLKEGQPFDVKAFLIRGVFFMVALVGSLVCGVMYQYLAKAAEIKEDNDSIV